MKSGYDMSITADERLANVLFLFMWSSHRWLIPSDGLGTKSNNTLELDQLSSSYLSRIALQYPASLLIFEYFPARYSQQYLGKNDERI